MWWMCVKIAVYDIDVKVWFIWNIPFLVILIDWIMTMGVMYEENGAWNSEIDGWPNERTNWLNGSHVW